MQYSAHGTLPQSLNVNVIATAAQGLQEDKKIIVNIRTYNLSPF